MEISVKCPRCKTIIYHQVMDMQAKIKEQKDGNRS